MEENAAPALASEVQQGLALGLDIDRVQVGKNEENVVLREVLLGKGIHIVRVGDVDGPGPEGLSKNAEAGGWIVVEEVFASEEQNFDAAGLSVLFRGVLCSP